ncbi:MAG: SDR family oxidoreductase [Nitrospirae bacterium]|nr:SDR family oxidoreductase [Nitrospirota bacterium]
MSYLQLEGKKYLIVGVFNKKSIAYHAASVLQGEGAECIYVVKDNAVKGKVEQFIPNADIYVCNVENQDELGNLYKEVSKKHSKLDGMLHSIAFANYSEGLAPFHETVKKDFLQAMDISCFSLINLSNVFKDLFDKNASVITMTVPFTRLAVEHYGYMASVKAALETSVLYLAKSFSKFSNVRFNAVSASALKTSSAAGIPEFMKIYLCAEKLTIRKNAVETREIADVIAFLLSNRSSAINGQTVTADAGMSTNTFDKDIMDLIYRQECALKQ